MLAALLVVSAGCSRDPTAQGTSAAPRADRFVIGQSREFNSLLPFANNGYTASELIGLSFSLLVTLGPQGYVPDAAARVPTRENGDISADGLTYTFHLRHGMRWQDGRPVTARDVLFTQRAVMDPQAIMPYRDGFDRIVALTAPDPYTVVARLAHPYRLFVMNFLGPESPTGLLPEHLLAGVADISHSAYANAPIGSGPYRMETWHHGESIGFVANPNWYGGKPAIARIDVHFIPDPSTRLTQLRTHEIDAEVQASAETATQMRDAPGFRVDAETIPLFMQITFNLRDPIAGQLPVRLAVAQSIDAPTIAAKVSHGLLDGRDPARGLYLWAYDPHGGYPAYDPRAAVRELEAAGWKLGTDGYRRDAAGHRLAFTLSLRADRADDNAAAVQVQQQLRASGIDVALKTYSAPQFTADDGLLRTGKFAVELSTFFPNIEPDPTIFFSCAARGMNGFNDSNYCDAAAEADMQASLRTTDRAAVRTLLGRAQRRINAAMPMYMMWQGKDFNVVPARLHNFSDLQGLPFFNSGHWTL